MKNNRGLTLIELLAVLVVLSMIIMIVTPTVTRNLKKSSIELCYHQLDSLVDASKNWLTDQMNNNYDALFDENSQFITQSVTGETLLEEGYVNDIDDKYKVVQIEITKEGDNYYYTVLRKSDYCQ